MVGDGDTKTVSKVETHGHAQHASIANILKLERQRSEFMETNILLSEREVAAQQKLMEKQAAAHELALHEKRRLEAALVVQRFIRARKRNKPNAFRSMVSEVTKHLEFARAQALKAQAETERAKELHAEEKTALQEQIAALQLHVERSEAEALLHAREKFRHEEDSKVAPQNQIDGAIPGCEQCPVASKPTE